MRTLTTYQKEVQLAELFLSKNIVFIGYPSNHMKGIVRCERIFLNGVKVLKKKLHESVFVFLDANKPFDIRDVDISKVAKQILFITRNTN